MKKSGFTLVELMIVMSIIGILSAVLFPSVSKYMANARDMKKRQEIRQLETGLLQHQISQGTYQVPGAGWQGGGLGWVNYKNPSDGYPKSLFEVFQEEGFIGNSVKMKNATDVGNPPVKFNLSPCVTTLNSTDLYMLYFDDTLNRYSISGYLEGATQADVDYIQTTFNGTGLASDTPTPFSNGTCTRYGRNYAVGN